MGNRVKIIYGVNYEKFLCAPSTCFQKISRDQGFMMFPSVLPEEQNLEFPRDFVETGKKVVEKAILLPASAEV